MEMPAIARPATPGPGPGGIAEAASHIDATQQPISATIEVQTATTVEVGRVVGEAALGNQQVASGMSSVSTAVREAATGAAQVQESACGLARLAGALDGLVTVR